MYCKNCGKQLNDSAKFCPSCGTGTAGNEPAPQTIIVQAQQQASNSRPCPKCKGQNVQFQTVSERKKTGCFKVLLYIFLAISILGWLILIPICLRKKSRTVTYGVCQSCGYRWRA